MFDLDCYVELASKPGVHTADFDQCTLGADATKPTRLLLWGVEVPDDFTKRCGHERKLWRTIDTRGLQRVQFMPHAPIRGRKRGKEWATKALQAYPTLMNRRIVDMISNSDSSFSRAAAPAPAAPPSRRPGRSP